MSERRNEKAIGIVLTLILASAGWGCDKDETTVPVECKDALKLRTGGQTALCFPDRACREAQRSNIKLAFHLSLDVANGQGGKIPVTNQLQNRKCVVAELKRNGLIVDDPESDRYHVVSAVGNFSNLGRIPDLALVANFEVACYNSPQHDMCTHCWSLDQAACEKDPFCSEIHPVQEVTKSLTNPCVDLSPLSFAGCQPADFACNEFSELFTNGEGCFLGAYCGGMEHFGWRRALSSECPDASLPACL